LVFFSHAGIQSLFDNFPDFQQNDTVIATFGKTTLEAAQNAGLNVEIQVPNPECPSMAMALMKYIKQINGKK
jgi:uroporphyrinogen-III synthase